MFANDYETSGSHLSSHPQKQEPSILSNHTRYHYIGSESWEHDDTGNMQNYSGCFDEMMNPIAEHEGWQEGYDY